MFIVTDVIYLPVESSETRVTADDETYTLIAGICQMIEPIPSGLVASAHTILLDGITPIPVLAAGSQDSTSTHKNFSKEALILS